MKKHKKFFTTIVCLLLFGVHNYTAFQYVNWSVRAEGMAGTFSSVTGDVSTLLYNPAGVYGIQQITLNMFYSNPFVGMEDVDLGFTSIIFALPVKFGSFALSYNSFNTNNLYYENIIVLNFSTMMKKLKESLPSLTAGVNLKTLVKGYNYDEEVLNREPELKDVKSISTFSLDLGIIYKLLKDKLSLGVTIKDVLQPNIAVIKGDEDIVPVSFAFATGYNIGDIKSFLYFEDFTLSTELRYRNQTWGDTQDKIFYSLGIETFLNFHTIGLRCGVNKSSVNLGMSYYGLNITEKIKLNFGYSFGIPFFYTNNFGNHRVSVEICF